MRSFPSPLADLSRSIRRPAVGFAIALTLLVPSVAVAQEWLYPVKPGEHLWGLAERFLDGHKSYSKLQQLNGIKNPKRMPPGSVLRIPLAWMRRIAAEARITALNGRVEIERTGAAARPADVGDPLRERDRLRTAPGAYAAITLPDGTQVRVLANSEVAVEAMATYQNARVFDSRLLVARGRTESIAPTGRDDATRFELRTRAGVTSVRGTVFRVATADDGDTSTTEVLHGRVNAGNDAGRVTVQAGFGTVMTPGRSPSPPAALLPSPVLDGLPAKLVRMPVLVDFPPVAGAVRYRLQLAADSTFSPLLADVAAETPSIALPDLADGRYAIRVRGIDALGLEGTDATRDFDISARPGAPRLEGPAPGALAEDSPPRFTWAPDGPADRLRYRFQLARDDAFTQLLTDLRDLRTPEYAAAEPLPPGEWHWRVAATDTARGDGPFGETRALRRPSPPPAQATIERSQQSIVVSWPAGRIHATLAPQASPQAVVAEAITDTGLWTAPRPDPGVYVLTARTVEADGFKGPDVTTQMVDVPPPPLPPAPTSPADNALLDKSPDALAWNPVAGAADGSTYRVQVERSSPTSDTPIDQDALTAHSASPGTLPPGLYRWRVAAATAADGPGNFSAWQTFRIEVPAPKMLTASRSKGQIVARWQAAVPATSYEVQLARDAAFSTAVTTQRTTAHDASFAPPGPGEYHARVRGLDADGEPGPFSNAVTVKVPAPLPWWLYPLILFGIVLP